MGIQIKINGEDRQFGAPMSVSALLASLELEPVTIAIERNLEIVPRSRYSSVMLADGDRVEIVQFIGGG